MFFPNNKIFIHIPKTGGSSIEFAITENFYKNINKVDEVDRIKLEAFSYENFSVHGHYKKLQKGNGGHTHSFIKEYDECMDIDKYEKFVILRNPYEQVTSLYNQLRKQVKIASLNNFILDENGHNVSKYSHYSDQYKYTHIKNNLAVDRVFVFDRYNEVQNYVEDEFKIKINKSLMLWKTEYTNESISSDAKKYFESKFLNSIELFENYL